MSESIRLDHQRDPAPGDDSELQALRIENAQFLRELENAYAQLTAIMQVSQDETRIAYSELQEKLVVLEKKLFEVDLLADVGNSLSSETQLERLRNAIVDKVCLALPVDLAALHLSYDLCEGTHRERDMVFATWVEGDLLHRIEDASALVSERPQPLIVTDLSAEPQHACLRLRADARSAAAIPLRAEHYLGVLVLNSRLQSNFRQDQEPLLVSFALQASVALKHALRYRRLENIIVHLMRSHKLPIECLDEAQRVQESETQFDRILETVRGLFNEDS